MSAFKPSVLCAFVPVCVLAACAATKTDFKERETLRQSFYTAVLRDTCNHISVKNAMPDLVNSITVYKTAFREKLTETGSVVSPALLNDESSRDTVGYKWMLGYRQDLYLVRVQAKCN